MIDLEKKLFDAFFNKASQTLNIDRYDAFEVWLERAKLAQAKEQETEAKFNANLVKVEQGIDEMAQGLLMEIESLKAQLAQYQSDDYVLVPRNPTNSMIGKAQGASDRMLYHYEVSGVWHKMIETMENDNAKP